jgi:predicted O-methyltransferase YrrM
MNSFQDFAQAIENANAQPALTNEVLTGFSGEKLLSTLINLSKIALNKDRVYLEVGVFQGMSLLSVANNLNDIPVYGIDNFAFFDADGKNESIVNSRISKLKLTNVTLINRDYEEALMHLSDYLGDKKVGLFFVDGPHDYRSQLMCLLLVQPYLSDNAIIIIDDSNYRHVRLANSDFLQTNSEFKLFFEAYTSSHPTNMSPETLQQARKGWWDGVNILVRDKDNLLEPAYPPTLRDRTLHENEHILQTEKYPTLALELGKYLRQIGKLYTRLPKHKTLERGIYDSLNTCSENLPEFNLVQKYLK